MPLDRHRHLNLRDPAAAVQVRHIVEELHVAELLAHARVRHQDEQALGRAHDADAHAARLQVLDKADKRLERRRVGEGHGAQVKDELADLARRREHVELVRQDALDLPCGGVDEAALDVAEEHLLVARRRVEQLRRRLRASHPVSNNQEIKLPEGRAKNRRAPQATVDSAADLDVSLVALDQRRRAGQVDEDAVVRHHRHLGLRRLPWREGEPIDTRSGAGPSAKENLGKRGPPRRGCGAGRAGRAGRTDLEEDDEAAERHRRVDAVLERREEHQQRREHDDEELKLVGAEEVDELGDLDQAEGGHNDNGGEDVLGHVVEVGGEDEEAHHDDHGGDEVAHGRLGAVGRVGRAAAEAPHRGVRPREPPEDVAPALRVRLLRGVDLVLELVRELGLHGDGLEVADNGDDDGDADEVGDAVAQVVGHLDGRQARRDRARHGHALRPRQVHLGRDARVEHDEAEGPGEEGGLLDPLRDGPHLPPEDAALAELAQEEEEADGEPAHDGRGAARLVDVGEEVVDAVLEHVGADRVALDVLELAHGDDDAAARGEAHDDGAGDEVHAPPEDGREHRHDDADHERDGAGLVLVDRVPVERLVGGALGRAVGIGVHNGEVGRELVGKADLAARGHALGNQLRDERHRADTHLRSREKMVSACDGCGWKLGLKQCLPRSSECGVEDQGREPGVEARLGCGKSIQRLIGEK